MANQSNFATDLKNIERSYTKYTVSRTIDSLSNNLLDAELPTNFPSDLSKVSVEISIYSLFDNALVYSGIAKNSTQRTPITIDKFTYSDGTTRTLLYINFSQLENFFLPIGKYQITLNILADELGSAENKLLKISKISPSRYEVELELVSSSVQNKNALVELATPSISSEWIMDAVKQIFNQSGSVTSSIPALKNTISETQIDNNLPVTLKNNLKTYQFNVDATSSPGVYSIAQSILNEAYLIVSASITADLASGKKDFTAAYLSSSVSGALARTYPTFKQNNYRFKLL
jgi:hypothetical protein